MVAIIKHRTSGKVHIHKSHSPVALAMWSQCGEKLARVDHLYQEWNNLAEAPEITCLDCIKKFAGWGD
jgi:dihydroxyacetone kinase-like predicted kinase